MPASDIPGYIQGYRFENAPAFYNSVDGEFIDQAGYDSYGMKTIAGTPAYTSAYGNANEGVKLNNTWHANFRNPIPWHGSVIIAAQHRLLTSGTRVMFPVLFGGGDVQTVHASGNVEWKLRTPSGTLQAKKVSNGATIFGASTDQSTRIGYSTLDGVTITQSAALAASGNGNGPAIQGGAVSTFGAITGTLGNVTLEANVEHIFWEMHFFKGNIWTENLTAAQGFMAELITKYK